MKILFDHPTPFLLAHGGLQNQIEETKAALERLGVTVEFLRWWDSAQRGDIIHFFGRPSAAYIDFAHAQNIGVVMAELLTGLGSRAASQRFVQKGIIELAKKVFPVSFLAKMSWEAYAKVDRILALTAWEADLMCRIFGARSGRVEVVPNGVSEDFLGGATPMREGFLLCTATVTERKRVLELAEAAVAAGTPLRIIGNPYGGTSAYVSRFLDFCARHRGLVQYDRAISDRSTLAEIYRKARGFVLLSTMESLSLSALEAAACGCPLLLSDLPWARSSFGGEASYCPVAGRETTAKLLRNFYDAAPRLTVPKKPSSWVEVAGQLVSIYEEVIAQRSIVSAGSALH